MKKTLLKTLKTLDNLYGVSGNEEAVSEAIRLEMKGLFDEYFEDILGNQYYIKHGKNKNKKIVISAHMDEIGFAVRYIDEEGKARLSPVGFHDERLAINQRLVTVTREGKLVEGITGNVPFHFLEPEDMEKPVRLADLVLDYGTLSREETLALGVDIGDYVAFEAHGNILNNGEIYCGKSVDNRAGCAVLIELMRQLVGIEPEVTVCTVFSVQEEVGMRAGGPIANRLKPDLFVSLDLTCARGVPGIDYGVCHTEINKGVAINYFDWDPELGMTGNNVPRKVTNFFEDIAKHKGIPYQKVVLVGGGTDSWSASLAGEGSLCGGIFIPAQYCHSAIGTVHINDLVSVTEMMVGVVEEFPF